MEKIIRQGRTLTLAAAVAVLCLARGVSASTAAELAEYINTITAGDLIAAASGNTVTVTDGRPGGITGVPTNADFLTLNIDADVTVVWKGTLLGAPSTGYSLINVKGGTGTFRMESGVIKNTGTGRAIMNSSTGTVDIKGGVVESNESGATIYSASTGLISISGKDAKVISDGVSSAIYVGGVSKADPEIRLSISNGTVMNNGTGYAIQNNSSGAINVSGGTIVGSSNKYAIYNYAEDGVGFRTGAVNISGGTVRSIYSARSYHNNTGGTVNISGGTIYYEIGEALNTNADSVFISGSAKITSASRASNYGTIYVGSSSALIVNRSNVFIRDATIENTAGGNAIYISAGTVSITDATVSSTGYAVYTTNASARTILGGDPAITGRIYAYPDNLSAVTGAATGNFAPAADRFYMLDFPVAQYAVNKVVVMYGRAFIKNFALYNGNFALNTQGQHLAMEPSAAKARFYTGGGADTSSVAIGVLENGKLYMAPPAEDILRKGYANDGQWYTDSEFTTPLTIGDDGLAVTEDLAFYLKWAIVTYTIEYDLGGGSVEAGNPASYTVESAGFTLKNPSKAGYTFVGWTDSVGAVPKTVVTVPAGSVDNRIYTANWTESIAVASHERVIPTGNRLEGAVAAAPVKRLAAGLTAGPTAALKQSGGVFFFRRGPRVESAALCVYDALGNAVAKIAINDDAAVGDSDGRVVGLWDLKDAKGHPAPTGTYLVKGAVAAGGKRERVSALVVVK